MQAMGNTASSSLCADLHGDHLLYFSSGNELRATVRLLCDDMPRLERCPQNGVLKHG